MLITKRNQFTGKVHTMDIPVTQEQLDAWKSGVLIQRAMPNLSPDQREFLITGYTAEEWNAAFHNEDEPADGPELDEDFDLDVNDGDPHDIEYDR